MVRKALGRGIGAIIPDVSLVSDKMGSRLVDIELDRVTANPSQPRCEFDDQALGELSKSIQERGVLQPVVVRALEGGFQLIIGERRVRAARMAGLEKIPAILVDISNDRELLELALVENLQREDLSPIDEARAYQRLVEDCGLTQKEISEKVGKDRASVANVLRLLKLPEEIQSLVARGQLSGGHARALLALDGSKAQVFMAQRIIRGDMSVRAVETQIRREKKDRIRIRMARSQKSVELMDLEEKLRRIFGTAVRIVRGSKKGRLEIEFYSDEDLERILEIIGFE